MFDESYTVFSHKIRNGLLILLSFIALPITTSIVVVIYLVNVLFSSDVLDRRANARQVLSFHPKTILVTGVGMTKGLAIARQLFEAGYDVIGADFEPNGSLVCGRVSRSLRKFYRLMRPNGRAGSAPYIESLLSIIKKEQVDLWISCSGVASATEDGEAKEVIEAETVCKAVQFGVKMTQTLHEKDSFIAHTKQIGLVVPETHKIKNWDHAVRILSAISSGRKFIMKPTGLDDSARGDMTLLPKASIEETTDHLARFKLSDDNPWVLQQYIQGPEFCTHSLVIRGKVRAFVACPSAELLMHYEALPATSRLNQKMLEFTEHYAASCGDQFTGHLSFDFLVEDATLRNLESLVLYPIECNPRAHTAVALFNGTQGVSATYVSLLGKDKASSDFDILVPTKSTKYYWIGHDLVTLILLPILSFLMLELDLSKLLQSFRIFFVHLRSWKDGTFEYWDPLPFWWLYHVYWPMQFLNCIVTGKRWSRINVSTTKMFEC